MMTREDRIEEYDCSYNSSLLAEMLVDAEDEARRIEKEVRDLHEPFPIYPTVWSEEQDVCNHCGQSVEETWGYLHDEDSEGCQYTLCLTNGPSYLVCRECTNDGADEVDYPCNTLKIFGVKDD